MLAPSTLITIPPLRLTFPCNLSTCQPPAILRVPRDGFLRSKRAHSSYPLHPSPLHPSPFHLSPQLLTRYTQVLRYTALVTGVGYGFYHQASIAAKAKIAQLDRQNEHQASLIAKAKAEWAKKTLPKEVKEGNSEFAFPEDKSGLECPCCWKSPAGTKIDPALVFSSFHQVENGKLRLGDCKKSV